MIRGPVQALFAAAEHGDGALLASAAHGASGDARLPHAAAPFAAPAASAGGARTTTSGLPRPSASGVSFHPCETQAVPDASTGRATSSKRPLSAAAGDGPAVSDGAVTGGRPSQRQRVQQALDSEMADDAGTPAHGTPLVRDGAVRSAPDRQPPLSAVREEGAPSTPRQPPTHAHC